MGDQNADASGEDGDRRAPEQSEVSERLERRVERKIEAREQSERGMWFGLGMFGLVGWAVAMPTLIGLGVGWWLDKRLDTPFSWTLALLVAGICAGCLNAWYWVSRESRG